MAEFKVGDVVQLKSGSPDMTITEYPKQSPIGNYDDRALCTWFDGKNVVRDVFMLDALNKIE